MISLSQELLEGILCFVDELTVAPRPKVRRDPVCPLQSSCIWCKASTYQAIFVRESVKRVRGMWHVAYKYFKTCFNLPQSSASGRLTRVDRKVIVVWISRLTWEKKSNWAVVWWNAHARSSDRNCASVIGRTWKRRSPTGVDCTPVIFLGNVEIFYWSYTESYQTWPHQGRKNPCSYSDNCV